MYINPEDNTIIIWLLVPPYSYFYLLLILYCTLHYCKRKYEIPSRWNYFSSSHSVDRYQIRKYPYCCISNTPLFSGVLRGYSRGISAARMDSLHGHLDGIFENSTPKKLAKAHPQHPTNWNMISGSSHDSWRPEFHDKGAIPTNKNCGWCCRQPPWQATSFNVRRQQKNTVKGCYQLSATPIKINQNT